MQMFDKLRKLANDDRGQTQTGAMAKRAIAVVVGLTVGGLVAAFLVPIALDQINQVETENYSDGAAAMWGIMDIVITLAVLLFFVGISLAAVENF